MFYIKKAKDEFDRDYNDTCSDPVDGLDGSNQFDVFMVILYVFSVCSRAKDVVAAARPPVRFFSSEAPVVDLYLGQLDQVRIQNAEIW